MQMLFHCLELVGLKQKVRLNSIKSLDNNLVFHSFCTPGSGEPPSEFRPITSSSHLRPYENGSLLIYSAQKSDSGYLMCQASNGIGVGLSKVIRLDVHGKSKISTQ